MKKIVICGGHLSPAIAVMERLQSERNIEMVFVGRTYPNEKDAVVFRGVRFLPLTAGRLTRVFTLHSILSFLKIPVGFIQAWIYILREQPKLVVSFGGYIALPVALAAWTLNIPVITHEQTRAAGLTNRIIARLAARVCVAFTDTAGQFPKEKVVVTGLPLRRTLFTPPKTPPYNVNQKTYPILYITGGSLGARSLNTLVFPLIPSLTRTWTVIHQVGSHSVSEAAHLKEPRYIAEAYLSAEKLSWVLHHAALVIGRSGANTVVELAALGVVSVLIPLPWAAAGEQRLNAQWLETHGGATVLMQNELTPQKLLSAIQSVWHSHRAYQKRAATFAKTIVRDADARVAEEILNLLP